MEQPSDSISNLMFGDTQSAILSLQLLDEAVFLDDEPLACPIPQTHDQNIMMQSWNVQPSETSQKALSLSSQIMNPILNEAVANNHDGETAKKLVKRDSELSSLEESDLGYTNAQILSQSHLSKANSKQSLGPNQLIAQTQENSIDELRLLKELQQKSMLEMRDSEHAEQIKQNFEVLFQKVYGIIQQIQSRNQKSDVEKSQIKSHLKQSARKQLSLNTRVVELHLNKENNGAKRKFNNIQTQFDYNNEAYDEGEDIHNCLKTESNYPRTPFNSSRAKASCLLSLSKQFLPLASPQANNGTARSDKSLKSKGLTLVSAQKKVVEEREVKKPVKITLLQKKIVPCPTKRVELCQKTKVDKKVTAFSPSNFFSSRRVSTSRII